MEGKKKKYPLLLKKQKQWAAREMLKKSNENNYNKIVNDLKTNLKPYIYVEVPNFLKYYCPSLSLLCKATY